MHDIESIIFEARKSNMTVGEYLLENFSSEEMGELQLHLVHRMQKNRLSSGMVENPIIDTVVEQEVALV